MTTTLIHTWTCFHLDSLLSIHYWDPMVRKYLSPYNSWKCVWDISPPQSIVMAEQIAHEYGWLMIAILIKGYSIWDLEGVEWKKNKYMWGVCEKKNMWVGRRKNNNMWVWVRDNFPFCPPAQDLKWNSMDCALGLELVHLRFSFSFTTKDNGNWFHDDLLFFSLKSLFKQSMQAWGHMYW